MVVNRRQPRSPHCLLVTHIIFRCALIIIVNVGKVLFDALPQRLGGFLARQPLEERRDADEHDSTTVLYADPRLVAILMSGQPSICMWRARDNSPSRTRAEPRRTVAPPGQAMSLSSVASHSPS